MADTTISGILNIGSGTTPDIKLSNTSGIASSFNINKLDIDFSIKGTGNGLMYFDASTGRLGIGTGLPDAILHVVAPCSKDGLIVESVTNCPTGVTLLLVHNPQTAPLSGSYPAIINLAGRDTNANEIAYGQIMSKVLDPITGYTSGEILFTVDNRGTNTPVFKANVKNVVLGGNNSVSGYAYTVVGGNNSVTGVGITSIGSYNSGLSNSGLVIGSVNTIDGSKIVALVNNSKFFGANNIAMGDTVAITGLSNIFIGNSNSLSGSNNILMGDNNYFNGDMSIGLAQLSSNTGSSGIVFGAYANNSGNNNIYIGNLNSLVGNSNIVVGSLVSVTGNNNSVYGSSDSVLGSQLIAIGSNQSLNTVTSGIFIGNDMALSNSNKLLFLGMGNSNTKDGLAQSILIGINNNLASGTPDQLLLIGQSNITENITGSVILGNTNNVSGSVTNNLVMGNTNAVSPSSTNNLVLGMLNNQTGVYIDSVGTITGSGKRPNGNVINSIVAGINNVVYAGNSNILVGNKNSVSGSNTNSLGSYNNVQTTSAYNIGNSNFLVGSQLGTVGSKINLIGQESVVFNTSNKQMNVFGSGNIIIGYNQVINSGVVIGTSNKLDGLNNIIYGRNNTVGYTRDICTMTDGGGTTITIPTKGLLSQYLQGDKILISFQNPPATANTFIRTISAIVEDTIEPKTYITLDIPVIVDRSNGYYSINSAFDDNNTASTIVSGLVMPYQRMGGAGGAEINPVYGSHNIVVGSNNKYPFSSGLILGYNNYVSGVRNIAIGYGLTGVVDDTLYLGTNNSNKMILDNYRIIFNSGKLQQNLIVKSATDSTSVLNADLNNNRIGINTDNPTSPLSVSGLFTTTDFKLGFSAPDAYVLTTNTNGVGTWQLPVRLSGTNGGMLFKVTDKGASGISEILYNPTVKQFGFNLGGNSEVYLNTTGLFINDQGLTYKVRILGSGGSDFARTLFDTDYANHKINFYNISGNSGNLNNLALNSGLNLPVSLTGTYLYVNNSGKLSSYVTRPNSILFANNAAYSTGNDSLRWINSQQVMAMGASVAVPDDTVPTNGYSSYYNIVLSSNSQVDTVFNNRGLANRFSVLNSGLVELKGFHISPTGAIAINTPLALLSTFNPKAALYVNGKTWVTELKIGNDSAPSGYYLRTDASGNIRFSNLDINNQFTGFSSDAIPNSYPLNVISTTQGVDGSFITNFGFTNKKLNGTTMTNSDDGTYPVFNGSVWVDSSGVKAWQKQLETGNPQSIPGIAIGYKSSVTSAYHTHAFAGGSFSHNNPKYDGSSQYVQYYLRTRTTGATNRPLVTNWSKSAVVSDETSANCINFNTFYSPTSAFNFQYDRVWAYQITVSVLWSNSISSGPGTTDTSTRSAGTYQIEGAVYRAANGTRFEKIGTESVKYYGDTMPGTMRLAVNVQPDSSIPRLQLMAYGQDGWTALWSATARVNQLNHLESDFLNSNGTA
jgi:hypothetical protein